MDRDADKEDAESGFQFLESGHLRQHRALAARSRAGLRHRFGCASVPA